MYSANKILEKICDESNDIYWIRSADFQRQHYVSASYYTRWGYNIQALLTCPEKWFDHVATNTDRKNLIDTWQQRVTTHHPTARYLDEYQAICANREIISVESVSYPIYDQQGELTAFAGTIRDVSYSKKLQEDLLISNQFLPKFLEKLEKAVFWVRDPSLTKQLYLSPGYEKIWGQSADALYRDPNNWESSVLKSDQSRKNASNVLQDWASKGKEASYLETYRIKRPDGDIRWIKDVSFPIYNENGQCLGFAGIAEDITTEKLREQRLEEAKNRAEQAEAAKSEFIRNMSHDLRTPLAGIIGALNLLQDEEQDPKLKIFVKQSYEAAVALLSTFNEILEVSKIEFSESDDIKMAFSLAELVEETAKLYTPVVLEKDLKLDTLIDPNLPPLVTGNRRVLHRILLNLLGNAVKFTVAGSITLKAMLHVQSGQKVTVKLIVQDTGIGIPKNKLHEIFLPFSRLASSYENEIKGSGLGLHIVKQFVQKLNGDISVNSTVHQGSIFTVLVPLMAVEEKVDFDKIEKYELAAEHPQHTSKNVTLLLVEDNLFAQRMAKANLENWGYKVDVANDGKEAIQKCLTTKYDLIYMDMGLPSQLDGGKTTQSIKKSLLNRNTIIIALTAHVDEKLTTKCNAIGIKTIIEKPLTQEKAAQIYETYFFNQGIINMHARWCTTNGMLAAEESMLELFMKSLPPEKASLEAAITAQNLAQVKDVLHGLIGSISYCDAPELLSMAKKMHQAAKEGNLEKVKEHYTEFDEATQK